MMLAAVIFDFDGVIADTEPLHFRAFRAVLAELGLGLTWEEYLADCVGFDDRDAFRYFFAREQRALSAPELSALCARKAEAFLETVRSDPPSPFPGVIELIRALEAAGVPLALCSGAVRGDLEPILAAEGLNGSFPVIVTAEDVHASKPDPSCYRLTVERLAARHPSRDVAPAKCVAIEDTPAGIAAAAGAGLRVLAVAHTHGAAPLCRADRTVPTLQGLAPDDLASLTEGPLRPPSGP